MNLPDRTRAFSEHPRQPLAIRIALVGGAAVSFGLLLSKSRQTPILVLVGMALWVLSPFLILDVAYGAFQRWSPRIRPTLDVLTLLVALASVVLYGVPGLRPQGKPNAFMFVAVPPASWLLIGVVLTCVTLVSRRSDRIRGG